FRFLGIFRVLFGLTFLHVAARFVGLRLIGARRRLLLVCGGVVLRRILIAVGIDLVLGLSQLFLLPFLGGIERLLRLGGGHGLADVDVDSRRVRAVCRRLLIVLGLDPELDRISFVDAQGLEPKLVVAAESLPEDPIFEQPAIGECVAAA